MRIEHDVQARTRFLSANLPGVKYASQLQHLTELLSFVGDHSAIILTCSEADAQMVKGTGKRAPVILQPTDEEGQKVHCSWNQSTRTLYISGDAEVISVADFLPKFKERAPTHPYEKVMFLVWVSPESSKFQIQLACV